MLNFPLFLPYVLLSSGQVVFVLASQDEGAMGPNLRELGQPNSHVACHIRGAHHLDVCTQHPTGGLRSERCPIGNQTLAGSNANAFSGVPEMRGLGLAKCPKMRQPLQPREGQKLKASWNQHHGTRANLGCS